MSPMGPQSLPAPLSMPQRGAPALRLVRGGAPARRKPDAPLRTARRMVARQAVRAATADRRVTRLPDLPMILRPIPASVPRLW